MRSISRRDFLHDSAALTAILAEAALLGGAASAADKAEAKTAKKGAANDTLHVAMIGVHGQGSNDLTGYAGKHNCMVSTICDCDQAVIGKAMASAEKAQGKTSKYEKDIRRVLDDKSIDLISI